MMKTNIRYAKIPGYAFGTTLPKYDNGTQDMYASTYSTGNSSTASPQSTNTGVGNFGNKVGNSMGWFAFANQAQTGVRANVKKKRIVNPKTGEVTEYAATDEGQVVEEIAQPYHEKYAQDIKNKEYGGLAAQLVGGPVGQIGYNAIWGKKKKDAANKQAEMEADMAQKEIDAEQERLRQEEENKQRDIYSRQYNAQNPIYGQAGASIYAYGTKENGTKLNEGQEIAYKAWLNKNKISESDDYDMRGYWKEKGFKENSHFGHFPDTYKRLAPFSDGDNYLQISEESKYSKNPSYRTGINTAFDKRGTGFWNDEGEFKAYAYGTKGGGLNRDEDYGKGNKHYPSVASSDFAGGGRSYPIPTKADAIDALRLAGLHGRSDVKAKVYAKYPGLKKMALGGDMTPLASNIDKAEGNTHEQGGIEVTDNNGKPKAEVEDQELIVDNNKVLSNRLPFTGGKTFADAGEEIANMKAENESKLNTLNKPSRNTAARNIQKADQKMNLLFKYQDVVRKNLGLDGNPPLNQLAYGGSMAKLPKCAFGTDDNNPFIPKSGIQYREDNPLGYRPQTQFEANKMYQMEENKLNPRFAREGDSFRPSVDTYDRSNSPVIESAIGKTYPSTTSSEQSSDLSSYSTPKAKRKTDLSGLVTGLENTSPYLDNVINAGLIKETPKIPKPNERVAVDEMVMPLNTKYNINPALAESTSNLREFNKTILDNTSNSNTARANIASGLAKKLRANNELYGQKENIENQLENQAALNAQGVNSRNVRNFQDIKNQNLALKDEYNWKNMLRDDSIRAQKSKLGAETTADLTTSVQDKRMGELDTKRIFYDSLKHDDASGFASLLGTPEMDKLMKDPKNKKAVYESLERGGQKAAHKKAKELYGE